MKFGDLQTPCFVLDESRLIASVDAIRGALSRHWPNSVLSYSVKTNSWFSLQRILAKRDVWAEVVSDFEFDLAKECGYTKGNFICNGASKSLKFMSQAVSSGSVLHLDSMSELEMFTELVGKRETVFGVRVNATEPDFNAEPLSGHLGSRFGLSVRDGDMDRLNSHLSKHRNLHLSSIHLHCNTSTRGLTGYEWLVRFFAKIVRQYGLVEVNTFDIGGSFGHDFVRPEDGRGRWPSWNEYCSGIASTLQAEGYNPDRLRLVIEPGSSLIGGCADYYTTIIGERIFNGRRILQIDGSRVHVDPFCVRRSFSGFMSLICNERKSRSAEYAGGCTCLEKDRIFLDAETGRANVGDVLRISTVGAYSYGLSPVCFIESAPAVYVRHVDGKLTLAQKHVLPNDLIDLFGGGIK